MRKMLIIKKNNNFLLFQFMDQVLVDLIWKNLEFNSKDTIKIKLEFISHLPIKEELKERLIIWE